MKGNNEDTKEGTVEVKIKQLHYESTPNPNIVITLDIEITNTKKTITINPSMNNSTDKAYDINESVLFTPISSYDNKITSTLTLNNKKTHTQKARVSEIIHSPLSPSTKYPFTLSTSFSFPEDKNTFTIDIIRYTTLVQNKAYKTNEAFSGLFPSANNRSAFMHMKKTGM